MRSVLFYSVEIPGHSNQKEGISFQKLKKDKSYKLYKRIGGGEFNF